MSPPRLLHLGFAFPPGVQAQFPELNPAGHGFETALIRELEKYFQVRSAGLMPFAIPSPSAAADPATGLSHALVLEEGKPEAIHRWRSLRRLQQAALDWRRQGWAPDLLTVYNLSPVYNCFVRWFRGQFPGTKRVLILLDSPQLGAPLPAGKRLRYWFKPMVISDETMLRVFDACIGLSRECEAYFRPLKTPFLWMPGGCSPGAQSMGGNVRVAEASNAPLKLGYFGALAAHAGACELAAAFSETALPHELHLSGFGRRPAQLIELSKQDSRIHFHGFLPAEGVLDFGASCDILVNPRPPGFGNQNNFPSKVFNYALCGRAIVSTRLSGVDEVLGPEGFYFPTADFRAALQGALSAASKHPRSELRRRGQVIRERVKAEFSWERQGLRIRDFLVKA